ncbi:PREDICTED: uncharacterized protein LOC109175419 [Ipomoea nil]|uniref:uncharacterized protein LOC109175419 n=1 Tax=Ipomoea nil TaxID=35883 RepID=UPI000901191E|nr:PREDICTED: uncharacterized protein LOC109175419 [Ipomoea nil]
MAAKDLICSGIRRRIGNGKSTLIWEHPWLPDEHDPMVQTEMPPQLAGAKIMMIRGIGMGIQMVVILEVKNGYRCIIGDYETGNNGAFDKWTTLWKLKIPPKWKIFLWRAISDILPTTNNLLIKRVDVDPMCAMCRIMSEDTMHSLVLCDYASSIWAQSNLPLPNIMTNIFHEWFSAIINVLDTNGIIYAAAILYHLWRARNGAVWDACLLRPKNVIAAATATMHAWQNVHGPTTAQLPIDHHAAVATLPIPSTAATLPNRPSAAASRGHAPPPRLAEQPPNTLPQHSEPLNTVVMPRKCYVDAGYHQGTNTATVGAVLLDATDHFISAFSAPILSCFSPLMVEAFACKEALSWLRARGEQSIQLYTDCQTLQCYLSAPDNPSRSYIGYAIDSCKIYMSAFNYCFVIFIPRLQNLLAHTLATSAFTLSTAMYWDNVPPDSISVYL